MQRVSNNPIVDAIPGYDIINFTVGIDYNNNIGLDLMLLNATDEDGVYSVGAYGSVGLEAADSETFIAYDAVTEAQAITWAQAAIGGADKVAEIHAALDAQLVEKKTPTKGAGTPWSA